MGEVALAVEGCKRRKVSPFPSMPSLFAAHPDPQSYESLADVLLCIGDTTLKVHSFVLSRSPVIARLLLDTAATNKADHEGRTFSKVVLCDDDPITVHTALAVLYKAHELNSTLRPHVTDSLAELSQFAHKYGKS